MIARLSGILYDSGEMSCVIDVGGVGYLVFCSQRTLSEMPNNGEVINLYIETHVRDDHIHLYGFKNSAEREWFNLLISVQGVGARVALGVLGVLSADDLFKAIAAQDKTLLTQAPSIGPKLGGRICSELKERVGKMASLAVIKTSTERLIGNSENQVGQDAISALVNLGYGPSEAVTAIDNAISNLGTGADLQSIIKSGLKVLAR